LWRSIKKYLKKLCQVIRKWASIKHSKGKADKQRSKIFSKLSKEISVAAKLGDKDPAMNPRLRSAIQAARSANMPKDNIERAIDKSSAATGVNFENLRYEGFGPDKIAVIVETLTDNKNRTASNIRTIFQKSGGSLGTQGSASHNFNQLGIIKIGKQEISDEKIFELAIESGADECISHDEFHEVQCPMSDIYNVKKKLESIVANFISTEIEWVALNSANVNKDRHETVIEFLETLEDDDDVQNVFSNANFENN
jgi:YebC/PmpR family DNA-binding regulatory protein